MYLKKNYQYSVFNLQTMILILQINENSKSTMWQFIICSQWNLENAKYTRTRYNRMVRTLDNFKQGFFFEHENHFFFFKSVFQAHT